MLLCVFFCFKQKTAYELRISDWSSDVCSSDLRLHGGRHPAHRRGHDARSQGCRRPCEPRGRRHRQVRGATALLEGCLTCPSLGSKTPLPPTHGEDRKSVV